MDKYLKETKMLDYSNENIQQLIRERRWKNINEFERLKSIYDFVRDEILFGYNIDDNIPASKVLADGYGQCNTKGTLFMAILRACNIPCRVHGFTIDKKLQKGAMTGVVYKNAPQNVFHSWVEVYFEDRWYELEAFILDKKYLQKLQEKNSDCKGAFCGYGVAVKDFKNLIIDFDRNNTYIQSEGINQDFGVYDSPDDLLKAHPAGCCSFRTYRLPPLCKSFRGRRKKGIKIPLYRSLVTPWVCSSGRTAGPVAQRGLSEHEQRLMIPCVPEHSAPTVTLTAAVHVLTSLAVYSV